MALIRQWSWVLGFAGALLVLAGGVAWWLVGEVAGPGVGFFTAGGLGLGAWIALDRERILAAARSRAFAYDTGSALLQVVVLLIAIVAFNLAVRHDTSFDLTTKGTFTLSDHTMTVLREIDEPIRLLAFARTGTGGTRELERLVRLIDDASPMVTAEWIDPLANPLKAQQYEVTSQYGTILLVQGERLQRLEGDLTESEIVQRLVVVQSEQDHRICWSTGHGESDPDDEQSMEGHGAADLFLEGLNYTVTETIVATEGIDRACEALLIVRPRVEWLPFEREALAAYVAEGGRVLVLIDPDTVPDFAADLERFGFRVGNDWVLDVDPRNTLTGVEDASVPVLSGRGLVPHPITRDLGAAIALPITRSVTPLEDLEGIVVQPLLRTSERAWAETNIQGEWVADEGVDLIGDVPVAAVARIEDPSVLRVVPHSAPSGTTEPGTFDLAADLGRAVPADLAPKPGGRVVVIGDADFANNLWVTRGNNRDLLLNAVAWLVDEDDQIGERADVAESLDISVLSAGLLCVVSVLVVPGTAALFAVFTLLRRRFL